MMKVNKEKLRDYKMLIKNKKKQYHMYIIKQKKFVL